MKHTIIAGIVAAVMAALPHAASADQREIKRHCETKWPNDRSMQRYCREQNEPYYRWARSIEKKNHSSRPERQKLEACKRQYPGDYQMINICYQN